METESESGTQDEGVESGKESKEKEILEREFGDKEPSLVKLLSRRRKRDLASNVSSSASTCSEDSHSECSLDFSGTYYLGHVFHFSKKICPKITML